MDGVVLISGGGSNLQSIIDNANKINLNIRCVISNNANAYGIKRAEKSNIPTHVIEHQLFHTREEFDHQLMNTINPYNPKIIILAGFMRILTTDFITRYYGKILNIHPSLLPKFKGLNTHQKVIDAGETIHGVSVHFVTNELDAGPIIAQSSVVLKKNENAQKLAQRVLKKEHQLYPKAIHWFTQGRLKLIKNQAFLNGKPL